MITVISKHISSFILKNSDNGSQELNDIYNYGIEILISSLLNIMLILLIGFFTGTFLQSLVFLLCFIPLRQFTGGWHANTYFKCNLVFCISYILVISLTFLFTHIENIHLICTLLLSGFIPVLIFCPVENRNKRILKRKKLKFTSILFYIIFSFICLCFYCFQKEFSLTILFTLLCVSTAVIIGYLTKHL